MIGHVLTVELEAKAHITMQRWIDSGGLTGRSVTAEGSCEVHRRFCELLPEGLLWLEDPDTGGIWSVARVLTRNVSTDNGHLARCDRPCRNDLDGRGHPGGDPDGGLS